MIRTKGFGKSHNVCCVLGCKNSYRNTDADVSFYRFPTRDYSAQQRKQWIENINRLNPDGTFWEPSKSSVICSAHFVGGKRSKHPEHIAYNPTIFPKMSYKEKKGQLSPKRNKQSSLNFEKLEIERISNDDSNNSSKYMISKENTINNEDIKEPDVSIESWNKFEENCLSGLLNENKDGFGKEIDVSPNNRVIKKANRNLQVRIKTIYFCCIEGCINEKRKKSSGVTYYEFPKNFDTFQEWIKAIKKYRHRKITPSSKICSAHFYRNTKSSNPKSKSYLPIYFPRNTEIDKHQKNLSESNEVKEYQENFRENNPIVTVPISFLNAIGTKKKYKCKDGFIDSFIAKGIPRNFDDNQDSITENNDLNVRTCSIRNCSSNSKTNPELKFHTIPKIPQDFEIWSNALRYQLKSNVKIISPSKNSSILVCSKHFSNNDYRRITSKRTYSNNDDSKSFLSPKIFPKGNEYIYYKELIIKMLNSIYLMCSTIRNEKNKFSSEPYARLEFLLEGLKDNVENAEKFFELKFLEFFFPEKSIDSENITSSYHNNGLSHWNDIEELVEEQIDIDSIEYKQEEYLEEESIENEDATDSNDCNPYHVLDPFASQTAIETEVDNNTFEKITDSKKRKLIEDHSKENSSVPVFLKNFTKLNDNIIECNECQKKFTDILSFESHSFDHEKQTSHCSRCGRKVRSVEQLDEHQKTCLDDSLFPDLNKKPPPLTVKTIPCQYHPLCKIRFNSRNFKYYEHIDNHHHNKKHLYSCNVCNIKFQSSFYLYLHLNRPKNFDKKCTVENCSMPDYAPDLTDPNFLTYFNEDKKLICEYCGKKFRHSADLKDHEKIHLDPRSYICSCKMQFTRRILLRNHLKRSPDCDLAECEIPEDEVLRCHMCRLDFGRNREEIRSHMKLFHYKNRDGFFECLNCNAIFEVNGDLIVHLKDEIMTEKVKIQMDKENQEIQKGDNSFNSLDEYDSVEAGIKTEEIVPSQIFADVRSVSLPIRSRTKPKIKFCCCICKNYFSSAEFFNHLSEQRHQKLEEDWKNAHYLTELACNDCEEQFISVLHYLRHCKFSHKMHNLSKNLNLLIENQNIIEYLEDSDIEII